MLGQDLEHADLDGAPGAATGEDERGHGLPGPVSALLVFLGAAVSVQLSGQESRSGRGRALEGEAKHQNDEHDGRDHEDAEDHGEGSLGGLGHREERLMVDFARAVCIGV